MKTAARHLARTLLAAPWQIEALQQRAKAASGASRWLPGLIRRMFACFGGDQRPSEARLTEFILTDRGFERASRGGRVAVAHYPLNPPVMSPARGAPAKWNLPNLETPADVAEWLQVSLRHLDWFADWQGRESRVAEERLRHYRYRWQRKRRGGLRLIESPKDRLKQLQRKLLADILYQAPPHEAAHGFRPGRCVATFVAPHVRQTVVLKLDLRDFFTTIRASRVMAIYRAMGYPEAVARLLTGLCTNVTPSEVLQRAPQVLIGPERARFETPLRRAHLPQGSPASPALANLAAFRLDCRLAGLARAAGANYTRYADDLLFSGGPALARSIRHFYVHAGAIALEEGFTVHTRKTRIMRTSVRQQAAGLVLNERPNIARRDYDRLKAILYNCVKHGAASQNRQGHTRFREQLAGQVAYVTSVNANRGQRLQSLFEQIDWD